MIFSLKYIYILRVCYLAGEFVKHLRQEESISDLDEFCIRLAGLCHDLGNFIFYTCHSRTSDSEHSNRKYIVYHLSKQTTSD